MNKKRVLVTGAAGQISYSVLFRIAAGEMFGHNTELELHLLELEPLMPMLAGVVMELEDCAFPLLKKIVYTSDLNTAMDGVNWALLIGSVPRKLGMERSDLLKVNGGIFTKQGEVLNTRAAQDINIFVVGNPCNTNCLIASTHAKDIPRDRFFSMSTLDELRGRSLLARKAQVSVDSITKMTIWGNHSATQFPDFYNAKISGKQVTDIITDEKWLQETFISTVQQRGAAVIKARGASSAGSAANAIIQSVKHYTNDTPSNESFSTGKISVGEYGVDHDLVFSFPCQRKDGKIYTVENLTFNEFAKEKFNITLDELRQERDTVKKLGLI